VDLIKIIHALVSASKGHSEHIRIHIREGIAALMVSPIELTFALLIENSQNLSFAVLNRVTATSIFGSRSSPFHRALA
jgi:hypothetical protein